MIRELRNVLPNSDKQRMTRLRFSIGSKESYMCPREESYFKNDCIKQNIILNFANFANVKRFYFFLRWVAYSDVISAKLYLTAFHRIRYKNRTLRTTV
jgi:hypothetical protein